MEQKSSFVMYTEYLKHIQKMSMEQRGELFTAILCYAAGNDIPELDAAADMAFSFIRARMDRDYEVYMEKVEKRREAGKLGGRPKKANGSPEKQTKAKKANGFFVKQNNPDTDTVTDIVTDTVTDNNKKLSKHNSFCNFEQRQYNYDELEKQLLNSNPVK